MIQYKLVKVIDCWDWDKLVKNTYGKPYVFQQQDGCRSRGQVSVTIPDLIEDEEDDDSTYYEYMYKAAPFDKWLERDPKEPIPDQEYAWELELFWERNFYPELQVIANDLYEKGLVEAGDYVINIDW